MIESNKNQINLDTNTPIKIPSNISDCTSECSTKSTSSDSIIELNTNQNEKILKDDEELIDNNDCVIITEHNYDNEMEKLIDSCAKLLETNWFRCGFYQFISFLFISITWTIGNGWYAYISVFTAYTQNYKCLTPKLLSLNENFTISNDHCSYTTSTNTTIECTNWLFDDTQMKNTIISEYKFICGRDYYFEIAYSIEQTGYIFGTLLFSIIADRIGRKPVFLCVLILMSIFGFIQFWIINFYIYMLFGFFINFFASGLDSVCVPLVLELVSTKQRTSFGIGMEYIWVIVLTFLSIISYFINKWRYLRLTIFIILILLGILSYWLIEESLTWLLSTGKYKYAKIIIERIGKFNRLNKSKKFQINKIKLFNLFNKFDSYNKLNINKSNKNNNNNNNNDNNNNWVCFKNKNINDNNAFIDIIRSSKYRLYVVIMSLNWFATALIYDGLTYLNSFVGENIFINWTLLNIVELPAQLMCHYSLSRFGRRMTTCTSLIVCGVTLLLTYMTSLTALENKSWLKLLLYLIAKFTSTQAYSAVILHSPEIFPTHLRSFGYGVCLFSGKLTAVISPFISMYLSKVVSWLPAIIYGVISIICGCVCLYVPETLNRPLPNSIDDVLKWTRNLTLEEWKIIKDMNKFKLNFCQSIIKFKLFKKSKCVSITNVDSKISIGRTSTQNTLLNSVL